MSTNEETINALRLALEAAPDNIPLQKHLADMLTEAGRYEEAEQVYRDTLAKSPDDVHIKTGLAGVFYHQHKPSAALVIIDELLKLAEPPALAFLLAARLYIQAGNDQKAADAYRRVLALDPSMADADLGPLLPVVEEDLGEEETWGQRMAAPAEETAETPIFELEKTQFTFDEVGGMDGVKEEIRIKIIHPLSNPELFQAYGKTVGGGILMYGPPGCGKTHLARATAGEVQASFISVGIQDVLDMWIGNSEKNLHELFDLARGNTPCVLFIDEVDALGASRSDMRHSGSRHLINQFLTELDGIDQANDGVLVLAATNTPWHLDAAFRRPGRFDRIIFVPPPDEKARAAILDIHLKDKPTEAIDTRKVARKTDQFSGADLKAIIDIAIEGKLHEAMKEGKPIPLTTKDLLKASAAVRSTTKEWFSTARNHALYANQSGLYDDILAYLKLQ
jgi:AAA+ superfamily predicted ATPase